MKLTKESTELCGVKFCRNVAEFTKPFLQSYSPAAFVFWTFERTRGAAYPYCRPDRPVEEECEL